MDKEKKTTNRICFSPPNDLKERFNSMAEETNMTQAQLMLLAMYSLVANYEVKGSFIFADLLSPDHREVKRK